MDANENGNGSGSSSSNGTSVIKAAETLLDDRNWGPVLDDDTITISLPNKAHDWIKIKRYITEDDDAAASQAATAKGVELSVQANNRAARRAAGKNGTTPAADPTTNKQTFHYDTNAFRAVLLQRMIREWSFKEPITARSIGALPTFTRDWIMSKIDELNPVADVIDLDAEEELDQHGRNTGPLDEPISASY